MRIGEFHRCIFIPRVARFADKIAFRKLRIIYIRWYYCNAKLFAQINFAIIFSLEQLDSILRFYFKLNARAINRDPCGNIYYTCKYVYIYMWKID